MTRAEEQTKQRAGIVVWIIVFAYGCHRGRTIQYPFDIESHRGRGSHTECGQCRKSATDRWLAIEDVTKAVFTRHLLHLRPRIGNGDELFSRIVSDLRDAVKEILLETIRLKRRAGFARDDEKRLS